MKQSWRYIICVIVCVVLSWYAGAMFNFFPFWGDNYLARELGFCTLILSVVIAISTCVIVNYSGKHKSSIKSE